ncbi:(2Fe-2S)-binding protein [Salinarchaeum laminariae]|uniref:(2Fe-2S)-binding protein n=1 Tax=Salinarchaeum laminariae TaxID=869888 RepID=UPI00217543B5|nr:(2Fe-2S)-binding protein [Salinarchaeum laminariae]
MTDELGPAANGQDDVSTDADAEDDSQNLGSAGDPLADLATNADRAEDIPADGDEDDLRPEPLALRADHSPEQVLATLFESIESWTAGGTENRGERRRRALQGAVGPYRTAFALSSPRLRTSHGDVVAFATAMADPITHPLFDAAAIERGPAEIDADRAVFTVLARPEAETGETDDAPSADTGDASADREPRTYDLTLRRQSAGKYEGCWLIDAIEMVYVGVSPRFRRMPTVSFAGETVRCEDGDRLRDALLTAEGRTPHNDAAQIANCGGNGLCGTCAVSVEGETDEPGRRERRRLSLPPFDGEDDLRLSCQTCVRGDVEVQKHDGLWGQHTAKLDEQEAGADSVDPAPAADPTSDSATASAADSAADPATDSAADPATDEEPGGESITVTAAEFGGSYEYEAELADPDADDGRGSSGDRR